MMVAQKCKYKRKIIFAVWLHFTKSSGIRNIKLPTMKLGGFPFATVVSDGPRG